MLLLVTILLVLVAAVTLLIGIFGNNLSLIFVSIGSSVIAALVLAVLTTMSKRRVREEAVATGPAPLPADEPSRVSEPATATESVLATGAASTGTGALGVPIEGYDDLRVNQILPQLEALDLDGLEAVAQHEENHKNRSSVLNRIDQLMDGLEAAGAPAAAVDVPDIEAPAAAGGFPIPDFDSLSESQIVTLLEDLDADELEQVAEYEETHANRDSVLDAIDDRLDELEGIATPVAAKATKTATKKKAAAKKATAKKATTTAARATKSAAKSTKAGATRKSAAKATKSAAKANKSAAKATKAAVKKTAPLKKATAAKKAAAKKSGRR